MLDSLEKVKPSNPTSPINQGTFTIREALKKQIAEQQYAIAPGKSFQLSSLGQEALSSLQQSWESLEYDPFYAEKEPTSYRLRRYTEFDFTPQTGELCPRPHVPYVQSLEMNTYVGGKARHFGDLSVDTYKNPLFQDLVNYNFSLFSREEEFSDRLWICQVHIMRIVVGAGQATAITPEGIHSDGYPFAGLHLMNKVNIEGGKTTIYQYDETPLATTTFREPLDSLWLEDRHLKHGVTDITNRNSGAGYRDILAISFSLPDSIYAKRI